MTKAEILEEDQAEIFIEAKDVKASDGLDNEETVQVDLSQLEEQETHGVTGKT